MSLLLRDIARQVGVSTSTVRARIKDTPAVAATVRLWGGGKLRRLIPTPETVEALLVLYPPPPPPTEAK